MDIKIEKNIPMPERTVFRYQDLFYKMQIGDSFFVSTENHSNKNVDRLQSSIMGSCRTARMPKKKFTTRRIKNSSGKTIGVRCWRIK